MEKVENSKKGEKYSKRMRAVPSVVVPSGKIKSLRYFEDYKEPSLTSSPP